MPCDIATMTRGRKKDFSIPPTRALVQQRDYRARKAHYISELEERCRRAESENIQLRKDLALARAGLVGPTMISSPQTIQASAELLRDLSAASASLARFQQVVSSESHYGHTYTATNNLRPAHFPSPAPSPNYVSASAPADPGYTSGQMHRHTTALSRPSSRNSIHSEVMKPRDRSSSVESECCGGIMDCRDLIETDEAIDITQSSLTIRTSGLRSTSANKIPDS